MGKFAKRIAPNKHNTLDVLYTRAQEFMSKPTDATILLGGYPSIAVCRCLKHVVGPNGTVYGYEFDKSTWRMLQDSKRLANMWATKKRVNRMDANTNFKHGDVTWAPSTQFEDIDLCTCWTRDKDTIAPKVDDGTWVDYLRANSSLNLLTTRLAMQSRLTHKEKVFMGTISTWGGINKKFTLRALSHVMKPIGWRLTSVDGHEDTYEVGTVMPGSYSVVRSGGINRKFRPHTHKVQIQPDKVKVGHRPVISRAKECHMDLITYKDSSPMLTFMISYK